MSPINYSIPYREISPGQYHQRTQSRYVEKSVKRCCNHIILNKPQTLSPDEIYKAMEESKHFLSIATEISREISNQLENQKIAVLVTDRDGVILNIEGSSIFLDYLYDTYHIAVGTSLSEQSCGTNAFGITLIEGIPIEVDGEEHFSRLFQNIKSVAAPFFDERLKIQGALGFILYYNEPVTAPLALATLGASLITCHYLKNIEADEARKKNKLLDQALTKMNIGMLIWDETGIITSANQYAQRLLGLEENKQYSLQSHIKIEPKIWDTFQSGHDIVNEESLISFDHSRRRLECCLSLYRFPEHQSSIAFISKVSPSPQKEKSISHLSINASHIHDELVGTSHKIQEARQKIQKSLTGKASVLIYGEEGTEKCLIARIIHSQGLHKDGPFIPFSPELYPSNTITSVLFGSPDEEKKQIGLFTLADRGTIYFQEISLLPLEAQEMLLDYLRTGLIRLSPRTYIPDINLRIIADTQYSPEELSIGNLIISELLSWLKAFTIRVPPLRERKEDIPAIASKILSHFSLVRGIQLELCTDALDLLMEYDWPGNERELFQTLEKLLKYLGFKETRICKAHFQLMGFMKSHTNPKEEPKQNKLEEIQKETLIHTLKESRGNVSKAARVLGVGRSTIWRWMKRMNISIHDYR